MDLRKVVEGLDDEIVLGAGAGDAEGVGFLEGVAADEFGGDLAGKRNDRDGIHHGVDKAGGQVGGSWAGRRATHADATGGAGVALGGEGGIFFVPNQHVPDLMIVKRVVEGKGDASGVTEHAIDVFADQAFEQDVGTAHQIRHRLGLDSFLYCALKTFTVP